MTIITKENVREIVSMERGNEIILAHMQSFQFTQRQLEYFYFGTPYAWAAIATYALKREYDARCEEFKRDYATLSEIIEYNLTLMSKGQNIKAIVSFVDAKQKLESRCASFALYCEFHECMHTGI